MKKALFAATLFAFALSSCGSTPNTSASLPQESSDKTSSQSMSEPTTASTSVPTDTSSISESSSSSQAKPLMDIEYDYSFQSILITDEEGNPYNLSAKLAYRDSFFLESGETFNKDLALMSLAASTMSDTKANSQSFYQGLGFDDIVHSPDYDADETKDTILYNIAHKTIEGVNVVALSACSSNGYKLPWLNNLNIGKTGNAAGFQCGSDKLKAALDTYLHSYEGQPVKLWFSGYSRSAALLNILASELLEAQAVTEENMYCCIFETPKVMDVAAIQPHPSIHNIINRNDPIQSFFPDEFGLGRAGVDIDIYDENASAIAAAFDSRIVLPEPMAEEGYYSSDEEFLQFVHDALLVDVSNEDPTSYVPDMHNRENFVDNHYQEYFATLISAIQSMSSEATAALLAEIEDNPFAVISTDGLYAMIKAQLDAEGIAYDDEGLRNACNDMIDFVMYDAPTVLLVVGTDSGKNNFQRLADFHAPELIMPLLLNYQAVVAE